MKQVPRRATKGGLAALDTSWSVMSIHGTLQQAIRCSLNSPLFDKFGGAADG